MVIFEILFGNLLGLNTHRPLAMGCVHWPHKLVRFCFDLSLLDFDQVDFFLQEEINEKGLWMGLVVGR